MNEQRELFEGFILKQDKPLTVKEASAYLDVTINHIYNLVYRGNLTFYKPSGKRIYFRKADLDKYLFRNEIRARED